MKKLKLNLDEIKVDSFEFPSSTKRNGTVNGFGVTTLASDDDTCTLGCTGNVYGSECDCVSGEDNCIATGVNICTYEETICYTEAGNYNCD